MTQIIKIPFPLSQYDGKIEDPRPYEVWVRSKDFPTNIARKILETIEKHTQAHICTIGAEAVNQSVKGMAIARQMWREMYDVEDLYMTVYFSTIIDGNNEQRTRMVFRVFMLRDEDVTRCIYIS